ncbi:MAG: site-2 protease family protein [Bacteroidota bacterium]
MGSSFRLGRIAGVDVLLHWTFGLLIAGAIGFYVFTGRPDQAVTGVLLILAVFGCVVLHEFGHALAARRYGVPTKDITLYPIGGVARLQRVPENPTVELVIALAGPAVNVAVAVLVWAGLGVAGQGVGAPTGLAEPAGAFWANLFWANIVLVVFNLLPAFPMDGGRVLRALLAYKLSYTRATQVAAAVGQSMAIFFAFVAVVGRFDPFLLFIALFVYLGAQQEASAALMRAAVRGIPVRQAMLTEFTTLGVGSTLGEVVERLLAGSEQDFLVLAPDGTPAGVLTRRRLVQALAETGTGGRVSDAMEPVGLGVEVSAMLTEALEAMQESGRPLLPITERGRIVGVLTSENVAELMMLSNAVQKRTGERPLVLREAQA